MNALLQLLTAEYGSPTSCSSARLGDVTGDVKQYKIDDENGHDCYAGFCRIFVTAPAGHNQIMLALQNSPHNAEVSRFVADAGGEIRKDADGAAAITIILDINDSDLIKQLAKVTLLLINAPGSRPNPLVNLIPTVISSSQ